MDVEGVGVDVVGGPAWSSGSGWRQGGRYPLRVELWLLQQTARLVPGVISTTPIARQYALHVLVAAEVEALGMDERQARELLCRCEVVLAAAYAAHQAHVPGVRTAHGASRIRQLLGDGVDMAAAARPGKGQYSENRWGFYGAAYRGPEIQLGLIRAGDRDDVPRPGERCAVDAVRRGLGPLLELARQPVLSMADAVAAADQLCACRGAMFEDGQWFAELLCGADPDDSRRRDTIRLIGFACQNRHVTELDYTDDVDHSMVNLLAYGDLVAQARRAGHPAAAEWQGTIFRFFMVWAWRRVWARLVNSLADGTAVSADGLAQRLADAMPAGVSVQRFRTSLPATVEAGLLVPAEALVHDGQTDEAVSDLAELMLLASRTVNLTGAAREAYVGRGSARFEEFGPLWLAARLDEGARLALPDFARDLAHRLINRAKRVAMDKARVHRDGSLSMNSKFQVADDTVRLTQQESGTALGLRLAPLASVLAGCAVLARANDRWQMTDQWRGRLA